MNDGVAPGGWALFEVTVFNDGPSDIDGLGLSDTLGGVLVGQPMVTSADMGDLYIEAGGSETVLISVKVPDSATPGDTFSNSVALVTTGVNDGIAGSHVVTEVTTTRRRRVRSASRLPLTTLSVTKTCSPSPVVPGTAFNCEVTVTNTGADIAYGVGLTDIMDVHRRPSWWTRTRCFRARIQTFECSSGRRAPLPDPLPAVRHGRRALPAVDPARRTSGRSAEPVNPQNYVVATAFNSDTFVDQSPLRRSERESSIRVDKRLLNDWRGAWRLGAVRGDGVQRRSVGHRWSWPRRDAG